MAWRPHEQLIDGELSNVEPGRVLGYLRFRGLPEPVRLSLTGEFHRDIRRATIRLKGPADGTDCDAGYMEGFALLQTGSVGDITAGREPFDYVDYPYIEWFSNDNGRVVLELEPEQISVVGNPLPWEDENPTDPAESMAKVRDFIAGCSLSLANRNK